MLSTTKQRAFTLLEVMIALFLATIFTSAILTSYSQICKKRIMAQELKKSSLSIELMRQRLIHLFAHVPSAEKVSFQTGTHPDAVGTCLLFAVDNGADPREEFCGDVVGMLYCNRSRELCLATWGSNGQPRQEVLLNNLDNFSLHFFDVKGKAWKSDWKQEDLFPPFFKISWTPSDQPKQVEQCAFFFHQDIPIVYEAEGFPS